MKRQRNCGKKRNGYASHSSAATFWTTHARDYSEFSFIDISHNELSLNLPDTLLSGSEILSERIVISLENNQIGGTVPATLAQFPNLDIYLVNNRIEAIPEELCRQKGW